jgi:hypothetical protein
MTAIVVNLEMAASIRKLGQSVGFGLYVAYRCLCEAPIRITARTANGGLVRGLSQAPERWEPTEVPKSIWDASRPFAITFEGANGVIVLLEDDGEFCTITRTEGDESKVLSHRPLHASLRARNAT